ncbi:hypothetical protein TK78_20060 [Streptomyces sp. Tue 6075]|uniref:hypothetical protein n=1 Tax=Streptomyces sp. Tue 6075 TaxID=1661694 RepID=UPI00094A2764|nr:hypothetical protein [Streptomyces sp. Tue 6075]APS20972.1 hypothetical protein TK78_20060 [Streptomyces sp. Tue 6075]
MSGIGLAGMPMPEWKIRTAEGKEYIFDSLEEAVEALPGHGEGATIWQRDVYRTTPFVTRTQKPWRQVEG